MKIKTFENFKSKSKEPQIGDYVICVSNNETPIILPDFIANNIGLIVDINQFYCIIKYKNIPQKLGYYFNYKYGINDGINEISNCRLMYRDEIVFFSNNIEDCEMYLTTKNFNL